MRPKVAALGVTGCHLILVICVSARAGGSREGPRTAGFAPSV